MTADGNPEVDVETGNHPSGREEVQGVGEREMGLVELEIYLQVQLHADEENDSIETKRKKRMARAALTMWKEREELFRSRILQGESEMRSIMNEVYNLVGLYTVFEGVVLTTVATSNRLECRHVWSPVFLSLFAYSMLVVVAFKKFRDIRALKIRNTLYKRLVGEITTWLQNLRLLGYANFDFEDACRSSYYRKFRPVHFWRNALALTVPLTIFTAGIVFSLVDILCWS